MLVGSVLLLLFGIGDLGASGAVYKDTGNNYIGAMYSGVIAIVTGILGVFVGPVPVAVFIAFNIITFIVGAVGTVIGWSVYAIIKDFEACATYNGVYTDSCGSNTLYTCYGNSDYYLQVVKQLIPKIGEAINVLVSRLRPIPVVVIALQDLVIVKT